MSSFETLLELHSEALPSRWRSFARRRIPAYSDEHLAWGAYAYGFKLAADAVAKDCYESRVDRHILYAPIFYLYRHYIELELKSFYKEFFNRGWISVDFEKSHNIHKLWHRVKLAAIDKSVLSSDDKFVEHVEKSFNLITSVDKSSMHSRYPVDSNGNVHEIEFDIEQFIIEMDNIETIFFGLSAMIDQYDEYMSDMMPSTI